MSSTTSKTSLMPSREEAEKRHRRRRALDILARYGIGFGGISVIVTILLIFFYLFWVVFPLFNSANIEQKHSFAVPAQNEQTLFYGIEEQAGMAYRLTDQARLHFFSTESGEISSTIDLPVPDGAKIASFARSNQAQGIFAVAYEGGHVYAGKIKFDITYPENKRFITPVVEHLLGEAVVSLLDEEVQIVHLSIQATEEAGFSIAAVLDDQRAFLTSFVIEESFMSDEPEVEKLITEIEEAPRSVKRVLMDKDLSVLTLLDTEGKLSRFDISDKEDVSLSETVDVGNGKKVTDIQYLAGSISLLIADNGGKVTQWFNVRDENNKTRLTKIRDFDIDSTGEIQIAPEYFRKGFIVSTDEGHVSLFHTTAQRNLASEDLENTSIQRVVFSPRADFVLMETGAGEILTWHVENEHPEVSWHSLWQKVWYEGYEEPDYIWQSSASSNDFEPKLSLVPISFGTLKAAFYAMLLAMPLAILGAIYAAYFMSSKLRQSVKPTIEIMEALPTVILGFLAGLWLAPFLEAYLPAVFALLIILPL
ncbi:MAG: phosphate ABC transporter permease, partial [Gammaproteobacteria bacterium]|nr:phosphate ABC transporter permease [Gammaproteobacteria bacterium]